MKSIITLMTSLLFLALSSSCEKGNSESQEAITCGCGSTAPLTEISWINTVLTNNYTFTNGSTLTVYPGARFYCCTYNNQNVFYLLNPASSLGIGTTVVFNCPGTVLITGIDQELQTFMTTKKNDQLLWSK